MKTADFQGLLTIAILVLGIWAILAIALEAQSQTVSPMYPVSIERLDFVATEGQTQFSTVVLPRTNFVEVFKNGQLATQELNASTCAPTCADYTAANVSGKRVITFLIPLSGGTPGTVLPDRVSLIYWR